MIIANLSADNCASNAPVIGLIGAYWEQGNRRVIERILALNVKILHHLAGRYAGSSSEPYKDLLQVGYVGLMKAVNGCRLDSGAKFSSYEYSMIEGELKHHFRDTALVIKRPRWARNLHSKVSEATRRLVADLGRLSSRR